MVKVVTSGKPKGRSLCKEEKNGGSRFSRRLEAAFEEDDEEEN